MNGSSPRVVRVGPKSASTLQALHAPLFDPPWTTDAIAWQLEQPGSVALATDDDELKGFILFRVTADEAEILILAVAAQHQGRGLGAALLSAALVEAGRLGVDDMWLEVAIDNAPALAVYSRAGFAEAGRRPRYYRRSAGETVDALLLRRALGPA